MTKQKTSQFVVKFSADGKTRSLTMHAPSSEVVEREFKMGMLRANAKVGYDLDFRIISITETGKAND